MDRKFWQNNVYIYIFHLHTRQSKYQNKTKKNMSFVTWTEKEERTKKTHKHRYVKRYSNKVTCLGYLLVGFTSYTQQFIRIYILERKKIIIFIQRNLLVFDKLQRVIVCASNRRYIKWWLYLLNLPRQHHHLLKHFAIRSKQNCIRTLTKGNPR